MSSSVRATLAALLIAVVSLVPAVARAGQALDTGRTTAPNAGFSKTFDFPPEPVVALPDVARAIFNPPLERVRERCVVTFDERIPQTPLVSRTDSLRAPPASIRS